MNNQPESQAVRELRDLMDWIVASIPGCNHQLMKAKSEAVIAELEAAKKDLEFELDLNHKQAIKLAAANTELDAWKTAFGSTQLSHSLEYFDSMQRQCGTLQTQLATVTREREALKFSYDSRVAEIMDAERAEQSRLINERDKAQKACAEMRAALGMDECWPLIGVLNRLALAARHLLHYHNCDCQGHEAIAICCERADEYSEKSTALFRSTDCGKGYVPVSELDSISETLGMAKGLIEHANKGAFENGVKDQSGTLDEGNVVADRIYEQIKDAISRLEALRGVSLKPKSP